MGGVGRGKNVFQYWESILERHFPQTSALPPSLTALNKNVQMIRNEMQSTPASGDPSGQLQGDRDTVAGKYLCWIQPSDFLARK